MQEEYPYIPQFDDELSIDELYLENEELCERNYYKDLFSVNDLFYRSYKRIIEDN